jgi:hypothetical protein
MADDLYVYSFLILYKLGILIAGVSLCYMGFRLFLTDKIGISGDLTARGGAYELKLSGAAPGIFFSLFGTVIICFSIFKGVEYEKKPMQSTPPSSVESILPEKPPF